MARWTNRVAKASKLLAAVTPEKLAALPEQVAGTIRIGTELEATRIARRAAVDAGWISFRPIEYMSDPYATNGGA